MSAEQMQISRLRAELERVKIALRMARFKRRPRTQAGQIFHSDRGSQNASQFFSDVLTEYGITAWISRRGDCCTFAPVKEKHFASPPSA